MRSSGIIWRGLPDARPSRAVPSSCPTLSERSHRRPAARRPSSFAIYSCGLRISFNASSQSTSLPDSVTQKLRRPVARAYWRRQLLANAAIAASRLGSSHIRMRTHHESKKSNRPVSAPARLRSLEMGFELTRHSARRMGIGTPYDSHPGLRRCVLAGVHTRLARCHHK
jgi:hypothetical protein